MTVNVVPNPSVNEPQNLGAETNPWSSAHAENLHTDYIRLYSFNEPVGGVPAEVLALQEQYAASAVGGPEGIPEWTNILHMRQSGLYIGPARIVTAIDIDVVNAKLNAFFGPATDIHLGLRAYYPHLEDGWDSLVEIVARIKQLHALPASVASIDARLVALESAPTGVSVLADVGDVIIDTDVAEGEVLTYSGGSWVNAPVLTELHGGTLISITGATISFTGDLDQYATVDALDAYALSAHQHDEYVTAATLTNYAPKNHEHGAYITLVQFADFINEVEDRLDDTVSATTLSNYAKVEHQHAEYVTYDVLAATLQNFETGDHEHSEYVVATTLSNYVTLGALGDTLGGYTTDAQLNEAIEDFATVAQLSSTALTLTNNLNATVSAISAEVTRAQAAEDALGARIGTLEAEDTSMTIAGFQIDHGGLIGASALAGAVGVVKTLEALEDTDFVKDDLQLGDFLQYKEEGWAVSDVYLQPASTQAVSYTILGTNAFNYLSNSATAIQKQYEAVWVYETEISNIFWCPDATGEHDYFKLDMRALQKDVVTLVPATGSGDFIAPASTPSAPTTGLVLLSDIYYFWSEDGSTWLYSTTGFPSSQTGTVPALVPRIDLGVDLGSPTLRFRDLHLSGNTVYLGGTEISVDDSGALTAPNGDTYIVASELSAATLALNTRITGEVSTLSGQIDSSISAATLALNTRITTEVDTLSARAYNIEQNVAQIVSNTDPAALDSLTELVTAFQEADSDLSDAITAALGTHTSELGAEVTRAQAAEGALGIRIDANESAIAAATLGISTAVARLDSHDSDIATLTGDISALETQAATLTGRIDAHDVTLGTLSATVATLSTNLSTVSGTVTAHTSDISTLQSGLSAEATTRADEDAKLQAQINDTVANTTANSSAINTLQTALSQVESGANAEVASVTAELNELGLSTIGTEEGAYVQAANATYIADATHIHEATVLLDTALAGIVGEFTTALSGKQESFAVGDGLELTNGTLSVKSGVYADASAFTTLSGDVTTIAGRVTTLEDAQLDLTTSGTGLTFDSATEVLSLDASVLDVNTAQSLAAPVQITVDGVVAGTMSFSSGGSYTLSTSFTEDMATQNELNITQTTLFSSLAAVSNRVTAVEDDYVTSSDLTPYATKTDLNTGLGTKQDALTFGTGLSLVGSTLSATVDLTGYATESYVDAAVSGLVDAAPGTLDTLNELASALGDDPNFATTVASSIGAKQDQLVAGDSVTLTGATISVDLSGYTTLTHLANTLSNFAPAGDYATQGDLSSTVASYTPLATHNTLASTVSGIAGDLAERARITSVSSDFSIAGGTLSLTQDYALASTLSNYVTSDALTAASFATVSALTTGLAAKQDSLSIAEGSELTLADSVLDIDLSAYATVAQLDDYALSGDYVTQAALSVTLTNYASLAEHNSLANSLSTLSAIVDARQDVKAFSADLELTGAGTLGLVHDYATTSALGTLDATVSALSGTVATLSTTVNEREHIVDLSDDFTLSTAGTLSLSNAYALSADVTTLSSTVSGINTRVTTLEETALTAASTLSASKLDANTFNVAGQEIVLGGSISASSLSAAISNEMAIDLGIDTLATSATLTNYVTASSLTANYSTSSQVSALLANKQNTLSASGLLSIESDTLSIDLSDYVTSATLAFWSGSSALTTLGTISAGTWAGEQIADTYIASADTWDAKQDAISAGTHITINGTSIAVAPELISAVEANTVKTGITAQQASAITANTAKVGFTNTLARNALSASGDLSYNSATGVMSYSSAWSVSGSVASTDAQITVSGHVLEVFDMGADMVSSPSMTLDAGSLTSLLSRQVDMGTLNQERLF